jgi:TRAP-type C4-dicarboxylate transport system permease small subunit
MLSERAQSWCEAIVDAISVLFGVVLLVGGARMAISTHASTIPTLGLSEAVRYVPVMIGGVLIALFAIEHLTAHFSGKKVVPSWH